MPLHLSKIAYHRSVYQLCQNAKQVSLRMCKSAQFDIRYIPLQGPSLYIHPIFSSVYRHVSDYVDLGGVSYHAR
jgi:hypothetical protein